MTLSSGAGGTADAGATPSPALITGAAGFIGSRLALALRSEGTAVRALVRPGHDVREIAAAGVQIVRGDASDAATVTAAAKGCSVVFHLAAARGRHKLGYRGYQDQNRRLTEAVASAALAGGQRLVVTSSATLTRCAGPDPQTEETTPRPNSAYLSSRLLAERMLEELGSKRGLDVVIARVAQRIMGPGARNWARLVRAVRDGAFRVLPRGGSIHSGDVDDIVEGLRLCAVAAGAGRRRFILGAASPLGTIELLRIIARDLGVAFEPLIVSPTPFRAYVALGNVTYRCTRLSLPHHFTSEFYSARVALDIGKARRELGYAPRFEPVDSVRRTVAWLRAHDLV